MVATTKVSPCGPFFSVCSSLVISTCFSNWGDAAGDGAAGGNDRSVPGKIRATLLCLKEIENGGWEEMRCQPPIPAKITTTPANAATYTRADPNLPQIRPNVRTSR